MLSERIGQTLAGRAAVLELLPYSLAELEGRPAITPDAIGRCGRLPQSRSRSLDNVLVTGRFPPVHDRNLEHSTWLDGYVRTYVERDVRLITNVTDLDAFARFVALCAGRSGQLLKTNSLASDAGVAHMAARRWLSILRSSYVIELLSPHQRDADGRHDQEPRVVHAAVRRAARRAVLRWRRSLRAARRQLVSVVDVLLISARVE